MAGCRSIPAAAPIRRLSFEWAARLPLLLAWRVAGSHGSRSNRRLEPVSSWGPAWVSTACAPLSRRPASRPRRQLVSDRAHPPRATNIHELRALQKARSAQRSEAAQLAQAASLSETLASRARRVRAQLGWLGRGRRQWRLLVGACWLQAGWGRATPPALRRSPCRPAAPPLNRQPAPRAGGAARDPRRPRVPGGLRPRQPPHHRRHQQRLRQGARPARRLQRLLGWHPGRVWPPACARRVWRPAGLPAGEATSLCVRSLGAPRSPYPLPRRPSP